MLNMVNKSSLLVSGAIVKDLIVCTELLDYLQ